MERARSKQKALGCCCRWCFRSVCGCESFSDEGTSDSSNKSRKETIRHVLTDKGTREAGMDALVGNLKTTKAEQEQLRRELDKVKRELENTQVEGWCIS